MKKIWMIIAPLLVAACSGTQAKAPASDRGIKMKNIQEPAAAHTPRGASIADLPDLGKAPELENEIWLNTDQPLYLADLRGKVVLLDMWTFG